MRAKPPSPAWDMSGYYGHKLPDYHGHKPVIQRSPLPRASLCLRRTNKLPRVILLLGVLILIIFLRLEYLSWGHAAPPGELEPQYLSDLDLGADKGLPQLGAEHHHGTFLSRRLLAESVSRNCTPPAIEQFPETLFTPAQRRQGAIVVHVLVAAYMFIALAIACDDYFVPACERICQLLNLSDDVAGATFLAAGSSAPELATACIGVFIAKDDIGLGAVVGSAVFNIMFVISVCALCAGKVVPLKWWPLVRDCMYYTISILALVFVIYDDLVVWYEAIVLLILYVLYIVLMCFNTQLEAKITPIGNRWCCRHSYNPEPITLKLQEHNGTTNHKTFSDDDQSEVDEEQTTEIHSLLPPGEERKNGLIAPSTDCDMQVLQPSNFQDDAPPWVLHFPDGCWRQALWVISLPLILLMFITVPDCRQPRWRRCYVFTFIMSILWIAAFSYIMVWMITVIGHTSNVPDTVMGLTFIAAGSSVPDAIASLIVVREGRGDMAVSNAVGSNVFDILLCLGLPWFLQTAFITPNEPVIVYSAGLRYSSLTLLSTVVFLLVATHVNKWRLTKGYGVVLMMVYICFNILACLYELNIFGYVHPPTCPTIY